MAKIVGVRQLKNEATKILREVDEEGTEFVVTRGGREVARIIPAQPKETRAERQTRQDLWFREWDALSERIAREWSSPLSAVEIVKEGRREL